MKKVLTLLFLASFALLSCKKKEFMGLATNSKKETSERILLAKTLGEALSKEPRLRMFIKNESLAQFDGDYDILLQMVLNKKIDNTNTFFDVLKKHSPSEIALNNALSALPLLTIYVPELPEFSAVLWDAEKTTPWVAIRQIAENGYVKPTRIYKSDGSSFTISPLHIPGFPVIVLKDNERVITEVQKNRLVNNSLHEVRYLHEQPLCFQNGAQKFFFLSTEFINIPKKISPEKTTTQQRIAVSTNSVDPIVKAAYNSGAEWQRDYIYYGLDPSNNITTGNFRNTYKECIRGMRFINVADYKKIADDSNDPSIIKRDPNNLYQKTWTDGRFEFNVSIFLNSIGGSGQELKKVFSIDPHLLFKYYTGPSRDASGNVIHTIYDIEALTAATDIEIVPWDFNAYGTTWKLSVLEYDPSAEITNTTTNTSTFGGNFEISFPFKKIGFKFGVNASKSQTTTYQYKTTTGSDFLGEGIIDFRDRIMVGTGLRSIEIDEVATGTVAMQISPKKI